MQHLIAASSSSPAFAARFFVAATKGATMKAEQERVFCPGFYCHCNMLEQGGERWQRGEKMIEEEQCCFLWIKERERERERTPSEALFIQHMHLLAREEDRMLFSACLLLAGCVFLRKEGTKPDKSRISDTTATINYSKSVCLSSNCRKKERKPQRLQRK
jgi:hypothetical protein